MSQCDKTSERGMEKNVARMLRNCPPHLSEVTVTTVRGRNSRSKELTEYLEVSRKGAIAYFLKTLACGEKSTVGVTPRGKTEEREPTGLGFYPPKWSFTSLLFPPGFPSSSQAFEAHSWQMLILRCFSFVSLYCSPELTPNSRGEKIMCQKSYFSNLRIIFISGLSL